MEKEQLLAAEFCKGLRGYLTPEQLKLVVDRNKTDEYAVACASHDFCDANEFMAEAYEKVYKQPFYWQLKARSDAWNSAWNLARNSGFSLQI